MALIALSEAAAMLTCMGKLGEAFKDGRIVGGIVALGIAAVIGTGVATVANAGSAEPAAVVETADPALTINLAGTTANGLAAEQEADAAAVEAARIAAEQAAAAQAAADAAAAQAAADEAARAAAEQATAADEPAGDPVVEEPPAPVSDGCPDGYIDDPDRGCHSPICEVLADGTEVPCVG